MTGAQGVWHCRLRCFRWGYLLRGRIMIDFSFLAEDVGSRRPRDGGPFWFSPATVTLGHGVETTSSPTVPPLWLGGLTQEL